MDDRNWQHVDLLPTIADETHIRRALADGRPLGEGSPARDGADKRFYDRPGEPVRSPAGCPPRPPLPAAGPAGRHPGQRRARRRHAPPWRTCAAFDAVDPAAATCPPLVWGTVPAPVPDGARLAVAVNGTRRRGRPGGVARRGGRRFAAFLPDDRLFAAGANRLDLYRVERRRQFAQPPPVLTASRTPPTTPALAGGGRRFRGFPRRPVGNRVTHTSPLNHDERCRPDRKYGRSEGNST